MNQKSLIIDKLLTADTNLTARQNFLILEQLLKKFDAIYNDLKKQNLNLSDEFMIELSMHWGAEAVRQSWFYRNLVSQGFISPNYINLFRDLQVLRFKEII